MLHTCGRIEGSTRVVLEQVIPRRRKRPHHVWAWRVSSNDAVSYLHLADLFGGRELSIRGAGEVFHRDVSAARCPVAINGTKGEVGLCGGGGPTRINGALDEDAPALTVPTSGSITRDGAVDEGKSAAVGDATTIPSSRIARDGAVGEDERAFVVDATALTATASGSIARDGAVGEKEYAAVVDATAPIAIADASSIA